MQPTVFQAMCVLELLPKGDETVLFGPLKYFLFAPEYFLKATNSCSEAKTASRTLPNKDNFKRPRDRTKGETIYSYTMQELKQGEMEEQTSPMTLQHTSR